MHIEMRSLKIAFSSHMFVFFSESPALAFKEFTHLYIPLVLYFIRFFFAAPETEVRKYAEDMRTIESDLIVLREIQAKTATLSPAHEVGSSCQCLLTWCMHS